LVIGDWSLVIGDWSLVIGHWSLVIGHWSIFSNAQISSKAPQSGWAIASSSVIAPALSLFEAQRSQQQAHHLSRTGGDHQLRLGKCHQRTPQPSIGIAQIMQPMDGLLNGTG
jgi:hypothetical protein